MNPLYNDIRYDSKIRYNVNVVCTKISGSCIVSECHDSSSCKYQVKLVEYQVKMVEYRVKLVEYRVKIVEYRVKLVEYRVKMVE